MIDKSGREDGIFERSEFTYNAANDAYTCPSGKKLRLFRRADKVLYSGVDKRGLMRYRARKTDCDTCGLKANCTPNEPQRKILRSIYEPSRDVARNITKTIDYAISMQTEMEGGNAVCPPQTHSWPWPSATTRALWAEDEFHLAATAQNLRKLAKLIPQ